jgi:hypothetical protein
MAVEPIVVLLLLFAAHPGMSYLLFLALTLVLLLPALYVGYKITLEMAEARS